MDNITVNSTSSSLENFQLIAGALIFVLTYLGVAFERIVKVNKTVIALVGSSLMLLLILPGSHGDRERDAQPVAAAIESVVETKPAAPPPGAQIGAYSRYVKFDVILLLAGMMIAVNLLSETGVFQYIAIRSAKLGRGEPIRVLVLLIVVSAVLSAFLDNVTTVLLIAPMTLLVADQLKVPPLIFLIPETLASNIGGTATMIGDPPNILIGNYAHLSFSSFLTVLAPFVMIVLAVFVGGIMLRLRGSLKVSSERRAAIMDLDEARAITDRRLLWKILPVMLLTLVGFICHGVLHVEPGVVAMAGAALLLLITAKNVEQAFEKVEWPMLFFLLGLFIVVSGAVHVGVIEWAANRLFAITGNRPYVALIAVLWLAGICAGCMNAFSFTAAALPIVANLGLSFGLSGDRLYPFWWALSLGACLGGNLTPVGTTANLVVLDISEKSGYPITFGSFMKWGVPTAVGSLLLSTFYLLFLARFVYWG